MCVCVCVCVYMQARENTSCHMQMQRMGNRQIQLNLFCSENFPYETQQNSKFLGHGKGWQSDQGISRVGLHLMKRLIHNNHLCELISNTVQLPKLKARSSMKMENR